MSDYIKRSDIPYRDLAEEHGGVKVLVAFASDIASIPSADVVDKKRVLMYIADLQLSTDPHTEIGRKQHEILEVAFQGIMDMRGKDNE